MKHKIQPIYICVCLLALAVGLCATSAQAQKYQPMSGNYTIVNAADAGQGLTRVSLQIRLHNPTSDDIFVQKLAMGMEDEARKGHPVSLTVSRHHFGEITQEFTVPTWEYEQWRHGGRAVVRVTSPGPDGRARTTAVELRPTLPQEVR